MLSTDGKKYIVITSHSSARFNKASRDPMSTSELTRETIVSKTILKYMNHIVMVMFLMAFCSLETKPIDTIWARQLDKLCTTVLKFLWGVKYIEINDKMVKGKRMMIITKYLKNTNINVMLRVLNQTNVMLCYVYSIKDEICQ